MKKLSGKNRKINKGMPSAVLLSIVIHAALFLLAGMLVVFTVVKKEEQKFEPPKAVERPKMKLKKPKVKIKKTSKPKPTTRIVTKMNRASMPDIQLPEMSGMGDGLVGGVGGFDMMPDFGEVSIFGSGQSVGNDLVGTFYDFNRDRNGRPIPMNTDAYKAQLMKFFRKEWKPSALARFYRSPKNLYATTICVPAILSTRAPEAFGEPPDTAGWCWAVLYSGQLVHKDDITFRFWGSSDDVLMVRVDGKVVLNACYHTGAGGSTYSYFSPLWQSSSPASFKDYLGNRTSVVGDWITLKAGVPQNMDVLIGEVPGGAFCAMLIVEVKGEEYEKSPQGGPLLPIFKTSKPSIDLQDAIYNDLIPGEASVTNGPVFSDYDTVSRTSSNRVEKADDGSPATQPPISEDGMRTWHMTQGNSLEAQFVTLIAGKAVLENSRGKQRKIPLDQLSATDREFIELSRPPQFNIDFSKKTSQWNNPPSPYSNAIPPTMFDYVFTAKFKQTSSGDYNHKLHIEFYAISKRELDSKTYRLINRKEGDFIPAMESNRSFRLSGEKTTLYTYTLYNEVRGERYSGYVVVITDERGEIIQHAESSKWLFENLDNLRKLSVGSYMNKNCEHASPVGPSSYYY